MVDREVSRRCTARSPTTALGHGCEWYVRGASATGLVGRQACIDGAVVRYREYKVCIPHGLGA
ncbi:hypothetical protein HPP92_029138 [Vanilla planifolia]|uniref:Uncharacterized protein n=1 Tax=Vanilla planifolia TaxID=51239 RepID=A0A835U1W4_VANPL|nr:hypothetical protein HPP92_029138 [Vanilla planifolia]KAG0445849.1 hypothetical protein HPP92_029127 [Vanilla planifolia]